MKRLIILNVGYHGGLTVRATAFKQFANDIKRWPDIKLLKELEPKPEVIIEFPNDKYQEIYDNLRKLDVVELIDSVLPLEK